MEFSGILNADILPKAFDNIYECYQYAFIVLPLVTRYANSF